MLVKKIDPVPEEETAYYCGALEDSELSPDNPVEHIKTVPEIIERFKDNLTRLVDKTNRKKKRSIRIVVEIEEED